MQNQQTTTTAGRSARSLPGHLRTVLHDRLQFTLQRIQWAESSLQEAGKARTFHQARYELQGYGEEVAAAKTAIEGFAHIYVAICLSLEIDPGKLGAEAIKLGEQLGRSTVSARFAQGSVSRARMRSWLEDLPAKIEEAEAMAYALIAAAEALGVSLYDAPEAN